mgnify:CR=1 FL=1
MTELEKMIDILDKSGYRRNDGYFVQYGIEKDTITIYKEVVVSWYSTETVETNFEYNKKGELIEIW